MSDTQTIPVDELEELFDQDIPCGGRVLNPCPIGAPATLQRINNLCGCPTRFKCMDCYTAVVRSWKWAGIWGCPICHQRFYEQPRYVPL